MTGQESQAVPYGEFVDWSKRLEREGPFFRRVFEDAGVQSVLDVGAGTARHSILFASWGLDVVAVDPSDSMLEEAEDNLREFADEISSGGGSVRLVRGGFGDLARLGLGPADALISTGNALPHVNGREELRVALADFRTVLSPGAVLVLHLLNHTRLLTARIRTIPPKVRDVDAGTRMFLRLMDYPSDEVIDFSFLTVTRDKAGEWSLDARTSAHTALPHALLAEELGSAGFDSIELLGDHSGRQLDEMTDESLIVVARAV